MDRTPRLLLESKEPDQEPAYGWKEGAENERNVERGPRDKHALKENHE